LAELARLFLLTVLAILLYAALGYPLVLYVFSRGARRDGAFPAGSPPAVSLIIAAHDEQECIREKMRNTLALDYPEDSMEIILASDASTDLTERLAVEEGGGRLRVVRLDARQGKSAAQNAAAASATGEILVFTDADAMLDPSAVLRLVERFGDRSVGAVSGRITYEAVPGSGGASEDFYWRMECALWEWEDAVFGLLVVNGPVYAVRRSAYVPPAADAASDFAEPILLRLAGLRVVLADTAVGSKRLAASVGGSFRRKSRVVFGGMSSLTSIPGLSRVFLHPLLLFQLFSHKIVRWCAALLGPLAPPFALLALPSPVSLAVLGACAIGLCATLLGSLCPRLRRRLPVLRLPEYLCLLSAATWAAFIRLLMGRRLRWWKSERA
jgi:cellulose synthase/poly-beta-1,6-N-acetylglucosamine synthase-like glycosyltransferase